MAQYKYLKQNNVPVIVDAAYKDGAGKEITSQYASKQNLADAKADLQQKIDDISGPSGVLTEYRKAAAQDTIDATKADKTLFEAHVADTVSHITSAERTAWGNKYDKPSDGIPAGDLTIDTQNKITAAYNHSQIAAASDAIHHALNIQPITEESPEYVRGIDSLDLAAKYDYNGYAIISRYATKSECNEKYTKPASGIPKADLVDTVQASLGKADAAQAATDNTLETTSKTVVGAINELNAGKQANISDLATIRSGATLGATSLQPSDKEQLLDSITTVETTVNNHISSEDNPHAVTKAQLGLSNVDNTSDENKPISTATQTALDAKQAVISDLEVIRAGATAGGTAVQPSAIADMATKTEVANAYQVKVVAGNNITIAADGKTISATDTTYSDATTTDSGLMSAADKIKLNSLSTDYAELTNKPSINSVELSGNKTLADLGITIPTLATLTTTESLTTTAAVGNIASGTTIPVGTSIADLLKWVFEGTTPTYKFYWGATATPTSVVGLNSEECTRTDLLTGGMSKTITTDVNQYAVFAISSSLGLVEDAVSADGVGSFDNVTSTTVGENYIFYPDEASGASATYTYTVTFKEA